MRIGRLAALTGTSTKTLRFYEATGLLPPAPRAANGYRDYDDESVDRLDFIRRGRSAGLTLAQVRQVLAIRDAGEAPCTHVHNLLDQRLSEIDRQIADLQALRGALTPLRDQAAEATPDSCDPQEICRYL